MQLIQTLFKKSSDARLDKLKAALKENETDRDWRDGFMEQSQSIERQYDILLNEFAASPSQQLADKILECSDKRHRAETLSALHNRCTENINQRILNRTRPALRAVLEATADKLRDSIAKERKRHDESQQEAGVSVGESPFVLKYEEALKRAEHLLSKVDTLTYHQLNTTVQFCLS
jgi:hypothetical protein